MQRLEKIRVESAVKLVVVLANINENDMRRAFNKME